MANGGRVDYTIGFKTDNSGLLKLKKSLQELKNLTKGDFLELSGGNLKEAETRINSIQYSVANVERAMKAAFNQKLGTYNIEKFQKELKESGTDLQKLETGFKQAGAQGTTTWRNIALELTKSNVQMKKSHETLNKIATTFKNTAKWMVSSSVLNAFTGSINEAYGYVKNLDKSLNNIQIVTGKNSDEMARFAREANNAAQSLGKSTTDYTNASLIYYQQGLSDKEVKARTDVTMKAANVTGQDTAAVSEELTAVWNGYKVTAEETEGYVDKLSAVAATTASDLEELSTAMSKVASSANAMGVDVDQLNGMLSTVVSVTRQAPESVGTAFKTIFARMGDLKVDGADEDGVALGEVSGQLESLGVQVLDQAGNMRDMGTVIEEVAGKWEGWTRAQQQAAAVALAGKRQYNNLTALFENWDKYTSAVSTSENAEGTLDEQQERYMESLEAHFQQLSTSWEGVYDSILKSDSMKPIIDAFTALGEGVENFVDGIGGAAPLLTLLGSIGMKVFSQQIGKGLSTTLSNLNIMSRQTEEVKERTERYKQVFAQNNWSDADSQAIAELGDELGKLSAKMRPEAYEQARDQLEKLVKVGNEKTSVEGLTNEYEKLLNTVKAIGQDGKQINLGNLDEGDNRSIVQNKIQQYQELLKAFEEYRNAEIDLNENKKDPESKNKFTQARTNLQGKINSAFDFGEKGFTQLKDGNVAKKIAESLTDSGEAAEKAKEKVQNFLNTLQSHQNVGEDSLLATEGFRELLQSLQGLTKEGLSAEEILKKISQTLLENAEKAETFRQKQEALKETLKQQALEKQITGLSNLASGVTSVAFAAQSLQGAWKALNDEDSSAMEKIMQVTMSLSMTIPTLVSVFKSFLSGAKDIKGLGSSIQEIVNTKATTKAIEKNTKAKLKNAEADKKGIKERIKSIFFKGEEIVATEGVTVADAELAAANTEVAVTGAAAWASLLAPILAVAAAVAVISGVVWYMVDAHEEEAKAAEQAQKSADAMKKHAREAREEFEKLSSTLDAYAEAKKSLDDLSTGTQEYAAAIEEANRQALELLETNKDLAQYASYNSEGLIVFNKGGKEYTIEEMKKEASQPVVLQEMAAFSAQQKADEAQRIVDVQSIVRNKIDVIGEDYGGSDAAEEDAGIDLVNKLINAINEGKENPFVGKNLDDYINNKIFENLNISVDELKEQLRDAQGDIQDLADNIKAQKSADMIKEIQNIKNVLSTEDWFNKETIEVQNIVTQRIAEESGEDEDVSKEDIAQFLVDKNLIEYYMGRTEYTTKEGKTVTGRHQLSARTDEEKKEFVRQVVDYDLDLSFDGEMPIDEESLKKLWVENQTQGKYKLDGSNIKRLTNEGIWEDTTWEEITGGTDEEDSLRIMLEELTAIDIAKKKADNAKKTGKVVAKTVEETVENLTNSYSESIANTLAGVSEKNPLKASDLSYTDLKTLQEDKNLKDTLTKAKFSKEVVESIIDEINGTSLEEARKNAMSSLAQTATSQNFTGFIDKIMSDKLTPETLDKDEDYKAIENDLKELKAIYPEIGAEVDILQEKQLVGTKLYKEALGEVQSKMLEVKEEQAREGLEEAFAKIKFNVDTGVAENELKDFIDKDYEINVAIKTDADAAYDELQAGIKNMQTEASKIGKDFVVSADEVRNLNNAFPGIIEGMEDLHNGTVRLNQETVNAAISAAQQEMLANTQATQEKLKNTKRELIVKRTLYQEMADSASKLASNEVLTENEKADAKKTITQNVAKIATVAAKDESDEQAKIANNSNDNAKTTADNWTAAYQSASDSAVQFANNAIAAADAAAGNKSRLNDVKGISNSYKGKDGKSEDLTKLEDYSQYLESDDKGKKNAAKIAEYAQQMVASLDKSITDIDGEIAQSALSMENMAISTNNVKNGLGDAASAAAAIDTDIIDIYHDINNEIKALETNLSKVQKEQSKLVGKDLMDNLTKQTELLERQNAAQKAKLALARQDLAQQRSRLSSFGVTFGKDGQINNYTSVLNSWKRSGDSQGYSNVKTLISNYDNLLNSTIPEVENKIQDLIDKKVEINISKFKMSVEIALDLKQAAEDWADFRMKMKEDWEKDYSLQITTIGRKFNVAKELIPENTSKMNRAKQAAQTIRAGGIDEIYGKDSKKALDDLKKYYQDNEKYLLELKQNITEARKTALDAEKAVQTAMDKQTSQLEYINSLYEHQKKVTQLLYGDKAYDKFIKIGEKEVANSEKSAKFAKQNVAYWAKQMKNAKVGTEAWEEAVKNWQNATTDMNKAVEQTLEQLLENYKNTVAKAFKDLEDQLTGGMGLDYIKKEMDLNQKVGDQYLDSINAAYGIQKLQSKYVDAINDAGPAAQEKITKAMNEQLDILNKKDKISQYDLDRAEKQYNLTLKQIALEEAQNNKTSMRLRRDSSGNYSFQYVADQKEVSKAKQEVEDAKNQLYNLDKDQYKKNLDDIYNLYNEYNNEVQELYMDTTLTEEKRQKKLNLLNKNYGILLNNLTKQNSDIRENIVNSASLNIGRTLQGEKDKLLNDLVPNWNSGIQLMADKIGEKGFQGTVSTAISKANKALAYLNKHIGTVVTDYESKVDSLIAKNKELAKTYTSLIKKQKKEKEQADAALTALENEWKQIESNITSWENATNAAYNYWKMVQKGNLEASKSPDYSDKGGGSSSTGGGTGSGGAGSNKGSSGKGSVNTFKIKPKKPKKTLAVGDTPILNGYYYKTTKGPITSPAIDYDAESGSYITKTTTDQGTFPANDHRVTIIDIAKSGKYRYKIRDTQGSVGWARKEDFSKGSFDTGGYTGSWGNTNGKLAVLHEKELVLNKADTINMLEIVKQVRKMAVKKPSGIIKDLVNKYTQVSTQLLAGVGGKTEPQQLDQNVKIEASFPNVKQATEIEQALNNLVNIAAQKAYKNKR